MLQFAPTDSLTTTLDYTYAENKVQTQRSELSVWFNWGPGTSSWTDGPVGGSEIYSEDLNGSDLSMGGMNLGTKNENNSLGFNVAWEVNDALNFELDVSRLHRRIEARQRVRLRRRARRCGFIRGTTTVDFSGDFPILNVVLPTGRTQVEPSDAVVTGSVFQSSFNRSEVQQIQAKWTLGFPGTTRGWISESARPKCTTALPPPSCSRTTGADSALPMTTTTTSGPATTWAATST